MTEAKVAATIFDARTMRARQRYLAVVSAFFTQVPSIGIRSVVSKGASLADAPRRPRAAERKRRTSLAVSSSM
jgi:hypothetical protein